MPPVPGPPPTHLQSGTTMGLSSMPRNSPRSFSAATTAFLASNLGMPWVGGRTHYGRAQAPLHLQTWPPHPDSLTRKGGGTLMRAPRESMMLMASSPCLCPTS